MGVGRALRVMKRERLVTQMRQNQVIDIDRQKLIDAHLYVFFGMAL